MPLGTSRLLRALRRTRARSLVDCERCGRDFVVPVFRTGLDKERWAVRLRCGECGTVREVVIDNAQAHQYEADLDRGAREVSRSLSRMRHEGSRAPAFIDQKRGTT